MDFLLPSIIYWEYIYIYTANIYIGNVRKELYFPCRGAPFPDEPVSQYRFVNLAKTDANDRTHENGANTLS